MHLPYGTPEITSGADADGSSTDESSLRDDSPTYTDLQPVSSINGHLTTNSSEDANELNDAPTDTYDGTSIGDVGEISSQTIIYGKDNETQWHNQPFPKARTPRKNILKLPRNKTHNM
ncbi:hypothetical protein RRG08_003070 [Elysia crispata]|uniref:Uncharacterized protein n=1 Tax=Elysia crispata TaxID=231223 RepID=A0AAE1B6S5_9GAST|nr:hypothetical protein RRG08_003070 [Elysia crispata]